MTATHTQHPVFAALRQHHGTTTATRRRAPLSMYARGRHGWAAIVGLISYPLVGYWLMFRSYEVGNSYIGRNDLVTAAFAMAVTLALAPRLPTWERNARRAVRTWSAITATLTIAVFALEPILIRLAIFRAPEYLRPNMGSIVIDPAEWDTWTSFALNNVITVSLVLITTATLGRIIGPLAGLATTIGLGLLANVGLDAAYGLNTIGEDLNQPWISATVLAATAIGTWSHTSGASGTSQLLDSRHRRF